MSKVAIQGNASGTGTFTIAAPNSNTDRTLTLPDEAGTVLTNSGYITADGTNLVLKADGTNEDARIDSSGNLLVGKTASNLSTAGVQAQADGALFATRTGDSVVWFNKLSADGDIVRFQKDGATAGFIGTAGGGTELFIGSAATNGNGVYFGNTDRIIPVKSGNVSDNTQDIGHPSYRWDDIYATNGTIQTSDRNEKQDIEELSEAEQRVAVAAKALMRKFRWIDAVEEKGDDARIHFGIIAQDLQAAFEAEGLDAGRYAMFTSNTWWEAEETYTDDEGVEQTRIKSYYTADEAPEGATERTRLGVRYPELLAFIIGAL